MLRIENKQICHLCVFILGVIGVQRNKMGLISFLLYTCLFPLCTGQMASSGHFLQLYCSEFLLDLTDMDMIKTFIVTIKTCL